MVSTAGLGLKASGQVCVRLLGYLLIHFHAKKAKRPIREEYRDFQPINSSGEGEMTSLGT